MTTMHRSVKSIRNSGDAEIFVCFEPSGMSLPMPPASTISIEATGTEVGELDVVFQDGAWFVLSWPTATLEASIDGITVYKEVVPVPALPPGMSMRDFMGLTGLDKLR